MFLVDKEIKALVQDPSVPAAPADGTAIYSGSIDSVTNIGYDLTAACFHTANASRLDSVVLQPLDSAFVECREIVQFDRSTCGMIQLRNSRIRMGLTIDAPVYQPGHLTPVYFRLTNMASNAVTLIRGEKYAMLMFNQLHEEPEAPYGGSFQKELTFSGMGSYAEEYASQLSELEQKKNDLQNMERSVYTNMLTILTVFIGIFTLLNVNLDLMQNAAGVKEFILFNLACLGSVGALAALLDTLMNRKKAVRWLWLFPAACFLALFLFLI